jgi:hypothetical protein
MKFKDIQKYIFNCFLLTIPILLWDYIFTDKLPKAPEPNHYWKEISPFIIQIENISRLIMFVMISFMPIKITTSIQKKGLILYIFGTLLYFGSWVILMYFPNSIWSKSVLGLLAPAYTPLFWLIGIGFIGNSYFFNIPFKRWLYFLVVITFIIFHNWHTYLIYFRTQ